MVQGFKPNKVQKQAGSVLLAPVLLHLALNPRPHPRFFNQGRASANVTILRRKQEPWILESFHPGRGSLEWTEHLGSFVSTIVTCHPAPPVRQVLPARPARVPLQVHRRSILPPPPTSPSSHHRAPAPRQVPAQAHRQVPAQAHRRAHLRSSSPARPTPPPAPPPPRHPRRNHLRASTTLLRFHSPLAPTQARVRALECPSGARQRAQQEQVDQIWMS